MKDSDNNIRNSGKTEQTLCSSAGKYVAAHSANTSQSEIFQGIFDNYSGTSGKIFDNYHGHYVGEVQILNV